MDDFYDFLDKYSSEGGFNFFLVKYESFDIDGNQVLLQIPDDISVN